MAPAAAPVLPGPQRIVAQDPRQQLMTIATLGAMLGAGQHGGLGAGLGYGTLDAQHYMQALSDAHQHTAFQQAEFIQQQQDRAQAEQAHRQQQIAGVLNNLKEQGRKAQDVEEFQRIATDGATFLSSLGMRGPLTTPQGVAQAMGTYVPPEHEQKFIDAWEGWNKNESNKALLEADPAKALASEVRVNVGTRAKPDYQSLPLHDVADRAGHGFAQVNGQPVVVPKHAATGQYQKEKMLVDGRVTDVLVNPVPGAEGHVFGLDGKSIDPERVQAFVPNETAGSDANYMLKGKPIVGVRNRSGRILYRGQDVTDDVTPYVAPQRDPPGGAQGGLTEDGLDLAATQYRVTGVMPPMGMGSSGARASIINRAAQQAKAIGQSPAAAIQRQAAYKGDAGALTKIKAMSASAEAFESKALQQADLVGQLSPTVARTQYPILNDAILSGKTQIAGDKQATLLLNAVTTFSAEYAKIMEGSTGSAAGSSDSARRASERLISASMNPRTLQATIDQMKREMRFTIQGYDATVDHISTRMGGAPPAPMAAPAATGGAADSDLDAAAKILRSRSGR